MCSRTKAPSFRDRLSPSTNTQSRSSGTSAKACHRRVGDFSDFTFSSGGFAHVYLVRTAQPVYGTTHHVLKRIAVPNEAMLTEVKKEVDIMVRSTPPE